MAIQCMACGHKIPGKESLHMITSCPKCKNSKRDMFKRIDDEDIDPQKYAIDKEWLEAHRERLKKKNE